MVALLATPTERTREPVSLRTVALLLANFPHGLPGPLVLLVVLEIKLELVPLTVQHHVVPPSVLPSSLSPSSVLLVSIETVVATIRLHPIATVPLEPPLLLSASINNNLEMESPANGLMEPNGLFPVPPNNSIAALVIVSNPGVLGAGVIVTTIFKIVPTPSLNSLLMVVAPVLFKETSVKNKLALLRHPKIALSMDHDVILTQTVPTSTSVLKIYVSSSLMA